MTRLKLAFSVAVALASIGTAQAGDYEPVADPVFLPTLDVPAGPNDHGGKEYSDEFDRNFDGTANPLQNIMWDGSGGVANTFNYTGSGVPSGDVDALAHPADALFTEVVNNETALLFSLRNNSDYGSGLDYPGVADPDALGIPVFYETTQGQIGAWASEPQVSQHGVQNLDALEVFGPEGSDDAYRFSLFNDSSGVSVWSYDDVNNLSTPEILQAEVAALFPDLGLPEDLFDVDALMESGPLVMFSLRPIINSQILGDGVYVWDRISETLSILDHGGHLWGEGWTATVFGEVWNVDALEAAAGLPAPPVPLPAAFPLFGSALAGLGLLGWRRRRLVA